MMRVICLLLVSTFALKVNAQQYTKFNGYGFAADRMRSDSISIHPSDTIRNKAARSIAILNNGLYIADGTKWKLVMIDTTFLSNRINLKLNIADTINKWVTNVYKVNDSTIAVLKNGVVTNITINPAATKLVTSVYNNTESTITRGSVVYISGRHSSNLPTIALAEANNEANSYKTFALVQDDIPTSSSGIVIQAGKIENLNLPTSQYTDGDIVYLSPTVPGGITITKPLAPFHICKIGSVTRAHPTQGSIEIKIENGWQLDELSDVQVAAVPLDSTILQFSRVDSLWHDVNPTIAMGNRFVKRTDSAAMLSPYIRSAGYGLTKSGQSLLADSLLLSTRAWRQKGLDSLAAIELNIADTATMLNPYTRGSGTSGQVGYWNATRSLTGSSGFTFTPTSSLLVNNSVTAASAIARGTNLTPTLTAAANNDVLVGLDINPTFTNGAFTGISNLGLRVGGSSGLSYDLLNSRLNIGNSLPTTIATNNIVQSVNVVGISIKNTNTASGNIISAFITENSSGSAGQLFKTGINYTAYKTILANDLGLYNNTNAGNISILNDFPSGQIILTSGASTTSHLRIYSNGNIGINQNTDIGFKLDINGIARIQDNTTVSKNQNAATQILVTNTTTGTASQSQIALTSDASSGTTNFGKYSSTTNAYKIISANNAFLYNGTTAGDIAILNDVAAGQIKFASGGSSTSQLTIAANGTLTSNANATASGAIARGANLTPTLVAAANNDVLVGLDINPTFTNGAFVNVNNFAARINGILAGVTGYYSTGASANTHFMEIVSTNSTNGYVNFRRTGGSNGPAAYQLYQGLGIFEANTTTSITTVGSNLFQLNLLANNTVAMTVFPSTRNVLIQNGGTFTDAGFRLDVNGTARVQSTLKVGAATTQNASAVLDVESTTRGFLPPRMTTAQRDLIATPAAGLVIYNTTTNTHQGYNGTTWNDFY